MTQVNQQSGFPTRSDTNWPLQPLKQARSLTFQTKEEEGLYYLCSENKGDDQLCSFGTADLYLCFCIILSRLLDIEAVALSSYIKQNQ